MCRIVYLLYAYLCAYYVYRYTTYIHILDADIFMHVLLNAPVRSQRRPSRALQSRGITEGFLEEAVNAGSVHGGA